MLCLSQNLKRPCRSSSCSTIQLGIPSPSSTRTAALVCRRPCVALAQRLTCTSLHLLSSAHPNTFPSLCLSLGCGCITTFRVHIRLCHIEQILCVRRVRGPLIFSNFSRLCQDASSPESRSRVQVAQLAARSLYRKLEISQAVLIRHP